MGDAGDRRGWSFAAVSLALVVAWALARPELYVSWTPGDEGALAQGAERVLNGELPHRDFVDLWSGWLDALNALAFRIAGPRLTVLRDTLLLAWLAALAAAFAVARRFAGPWGAGFVTVAIAAWTVPWSPHPLPSWYTTFLALGAAAAVARYLDARRPLWMVLAGAALGAACAVKITGLYYVAAAALLCVWLVQDDPDVAVDARRPGPLDPYAWLVTLGLAGFALLVVKVVRPVLSSNAAYHFLFPTALLAGALAWREWTRPAPPAAVRFARLARVSVPLLAGFGAAIAAWIAPYVMTGSLDALTTGVFVTPQLRYTLVTYPLPGMRSALPALVPFALLLAAGPYVRQPLSRADRVALWGLCAAVGLLSYDGSPIVLVVWYGLRLLAPVTAVLAVWWLAARPAEANPARRALAFFLVSAGVVGSLVQVPFALYTYFLYFAPFLGLALLGLGATQPRMPRELLFALGVMLAVFGVRRPDSLDRRDTPPGDTPALLATPRGGIFVPRSDSTRYAPLLDAIGRHGAGRGLYVWHDAPEVYFLAGKRNPTPTMFEAFDRPAWAEADTLRHALEAHDVGVVVLKDAEGAVRPLPPEFRAWIDSAYPGRERVPGFDVRWRAGAPPGR